MDHGEEEEKVKVLGVWSSPYVLKVIWALRIKGVEYEYVEEDLAAKSSALLQHNPVHKKVPVLLYHGKPVAESEVIVEFIDDAWKGRGGRILPEDPYERAMARFWARFGQDKGEELEAAREAAVEQLLVLEGELAGKKFFAGETIGFVDLSLGSLSFVVPIYEEILGERLVTEERFPSLSAWMGSFLSSPPVKDHLPPMDKLKIRYQGIREWFLKSKQVISA